MTDYCLTCLYEDYDGAEEPCINCVGVGGKRPSEYFPKKPQKPITNADRIRSMSDEELAEYLAPCACPPIRFNKNTGDIVCPVNKEPSASDCKSCWLDWLKEEADRE